jgi:hypothetical protein
MEAKPLREEVVEYELPSSPFRIFTSLTSLMYQSVELCQANQSK